MSNYRKTMTEALREMYSLDESVIDKVKEIASKKQAMKIDGVMVDSFTASAISQIYDKVNDANKKKMDSLPITKLANLAMKMMQKNEFVPEEVDLDEDASNFKSAVARIKKAKSAKDLKKLEKSFERVYKQTGALTDKEFGQLDDMISDKLVKLGEEVDLDKLPDMSDALRQVRMNEEVDLDEALAPNVVRGDDYVGVPDRVVALAKQKVKKMNTSTASDHSKAMQKALSDMGWEMTVSGKYVKEEAGLDEAPRRPKAPKMKTTDIMRDRGKKAGPQTYQVDIKGVGRATVKAANEKMAIQKAMTQLKVNKNIKPLPKATVKVEELDEAILKDRDYEYDEKEGVVKISKKNFAKVRKDAKGTDKSKPTMMVLTKKGTSLVPVKFTEEVDLDEGKMSQLHQLIKDKKSAEEIAKLMKVDVKTIKALMSSYESTDGDDMSENGAYMEMLAAACGSPAASTYVTHYDPMDEGAAADARRAMSRDKDFSRKDSADDDTDATDDDVKGASKNIMMQMRKAQSLRGRFDVEFADGKKTKVSAGVAMAVQSKYNSLKKPADKEKFQARIGKSYKDMLKALKEELQPKKESILERMNRKIKEKNDG